MEKYVNYPFTRWSAIVSFKPYYNNFNINKNKLSKNIVFRSSSIILKLCTKYWHSFSTLRCLFVNYLVWRLIRRIKIWVRCYDVQIVYTWNCKVSGQIFMIPLLTPQYIQWCSVVISGQGQRWQRCLGHSVDSQHCDILLLAAASSLSRPNMIYQW